MALNDNRLDVAERILKPHLKEDPFDAAAIRMLAELAARIGRLTDAENLLRRAVELAPGWTAAQGQSGDGARPHRAGRRKRMELLDDIFADEPDELGHWNLKAATLGAPRRLRRGASRSTKQVLAARAGAAAGAG